MLIGSVLHETSISGLGALGSPEPDAEGSPTGIENEKLAVAGARGSWAFAS
jgi:hypothetical protein